MDGFGCNQASLLYFENFCSVDCNENTEHIAGFSSHEMQWDLVMFLSLAKRNRLQITFGFFEINSEPPNQILFLYDDQVIQALIIAKVRFMVSKIQANYPYCCSQYTLNQESM